ncbi:MAG: hypothetical protein R3E09_10635 [Novosphingobium sp.]
MRRTNQGRQPIVNLDRVEAGLCAHPSAAFAQYRPGQLCPAAASLRRCGKRDRSLGLISRCRTRRQAISRPAPERRIEDEIGVVKRAGARYLFHDLPDYPPLLARRKTRRRDPGGAWRIERGDPTGCGDRGRAQRWQRQ